MELLNKFDRIINGEAHLGEEDEGSIETVRQLKDFVDDIGDALELHEDPLQIYLVMENMIEFASEIKNRVKNEAMIQLREDILDNDEKTTEYFGNSVTLSASPVYKYPKDPQINRYISEIEELEQAYKPRIKTLTDAVKTRQKQLQLDGKAEQIDINYQLRIKKK